MLAALTARPSIARRRSGTVIDVLLTMAALGGTLGLYAHSGFAGSTAARQLDPLGGVLAVCSSLPLLVWRRFPLGVFVASTLVSAIAMLLGYPGAPPLAATAALFLLAASRDQEHPWTRRTTAVVVGLFAAHVGAFSIGQGAAPILALSIGALVWAVAWFAGDRRRMRRAEISELEQRAVRAEQEAERERRLAAAEERARIARDLHDSAGHAINVIAVQAGAARLLAQRDPARSRDALETIEHVARQTVGEIDQIVRTLRDGGARDDGRDGGVETPPGLAALDTLVAHHATTGLEVTVTTQGQRRPLVGATDQAVYRILQEALTNAARHGGGSVQIDLTFGERALELAVVNPMREDSTVRASGGHGLIGMRERATLLGGELSTERMNGDFRVRARLPYGGHE